MSADGFKPTDSDDGPPPRSEDGPLGPLPRFRRSQVGVERQLGAAGPAAAARLVEAWNQLLGGGMVADQFAIQWRAAGLRRPGVVAHLVWPRLRTRVGFGIDPPLAHAVVDRLLGHERTPAEARLQVSPVEWGVLTFLIASGLECLDARVGPLGPWDLTIDRVGPDPFDPTDLGPIVTYRWRVRVGPMLGSARLWLPESLLTLWRENLPPAPGSAALALGGIAEARAEGLVPLTDLTAEWRIEAGRITLDRALVAEPLVPGRILLLDDAPLAGSIEHPAGPVLLTQTGKETRGQIPTRLDPEAANRLVVTARPVWTSTSRNPLMTNAHESARREPNQPAAPSIVEPAVALTVELGRLTLTLRRLATLEVGDVIELDRQQAEPVDLTADGRLIARGELVQIDTELGVRITRVDL